MPARPFDAARFEALRDARGLRLGAPLVALAETGSTNDDALAAARAGSAQGALFVADLQSAGRGRRGHAWSSPPGENLTFSLLLRPHVSPERAPLVALVAGLAVRAAAARRVPEPLTLKWPNDVLARDRKLAGILVESRLVGDRLEAIVVGIGINVHTRDMPAEIRTVATSLSLLGDPSPDREVLLADVLAELEPRLAAFEGAGLGGLLPELRAHDALRGEPVTVGDISGIGAGFDEDGALLVRTGAGELHHVTSGSVQRG